MRNLYIAVMAIAMMSLFSAAALASNASNVVVPKGKRPAANGQLYKIQVPSDVEAPNVVREVYYAGSWFCDNNQEVEVRYENVQYNIVQRVPELSENNPSMVSLSGVTNEDGFGRIRNLEGYMSFLPSQQTVFITFAGQFCETQYSQEYDYETGNWTCTVDPEPTCLPVDYYLKGELKMTIDPDVK